MKKPEWIVHMQKVKEIKLKIASAFRVVRKKGILARSNFMCCSGCAGSELSIMAHKKSGSIGYVFYHSQDNERLLKSGKVHIGFSSSGHVPTLRIAERLIVALQDAGLSTSWNHMESSKVEVTGVAC